MIIQQFNGASNGAQFALDRGCAEWHAPPAFSDQRSVTVIRTVARYASLRLRSANSLTSLSILPLSPPCAIGWFNGASMAHQWRKIAVCAISTLQKCSLTNMLQVMAHCAIRKAQQIALLRHWDPLGKNPLMAHPPLPLLNGAAKGAGAAVDSRGFSQGSSHCPAVWQWRLAP